MAKTRKTTAKAPKQPEDMVDFVVRRFQASWQYAQSNYHIRWRNSWKLYNNKRTDVGYSGVSKVFVPITHSVVETIVGALASSKPTFDFLPPQDKQDQKTDILNALLSGYWDKDQWDIKVQNWIRSTLIFGTGVVYMQWNIDHPEMVNIPIRDFFFDPNATSLESSDVTFYAGRRYITTKAELESYEVVDPDSQEMKKKYHNLDKLTTSSADTANTDKSQKEMLYGAQAPNMPDSVPVEVLEFWTADKTISIANRTVEIQNDDNVYKIQSKKNGDKNPKGIIPFAAQRDFVDESLFYGRGEPEIFGTLQEWLNDLTNQNADAISYILNPMWNLDPSVKDLQPQIQAAPGAVFPISANNLTPVEMPVIPQQAFEERMNIKNEIRETTAVSEVVEGATQQTQATATQINAQVAQAGARIGMKVTQMESEGFHRLARLVFRMIQLYVTKPIGVRVLGDNPTWQQFDPKEFTGEYEPKVQLDTNVQAKKQKDQQNAVNMYMALAKDPQINQLELKRLVIPKMFDIDPDEVDQLLMQPMGLGAPGEAPPPMPGTPEMPPDGLPPGVMPPPPPDPTMGGTNGLSAVPALGAPGVNPI